MTFLHIQFKTQIEANIDKTSILKCNNLTLGYEEIDEEDNQKPCLVIYMQLGSRTNELYNKVYFHDDLALNEKINELLSKFKQSTKVKIQTDDECKSKFKMTDEVAKYLREKQFVLATRGINRNNFPFLTDDECNALDNLAFAQHILKDKLKPNVQNELANYESICMFKHLMPDKTGIENAKKHASEQKKKPRRSK